MLVTVENRTAGCDWAARPWPWCRGVAESMRTNQHPERRQDAGCGPSASASNGGLRIGVLIVAYNAATTLVDVLRRIPAEVWANVEAVAVFDDASTDNTVAVVQTYRATRQDDRLRIVQNPHNLGYGGNQKRGYQHFIAQGFDIVVLLHGDGQYAPELLPDLYAPIVAGQADAVLGSRITSRYGGPLQGGMPLYKYVGNRLLTAIANASLKMHLSEFHCGYRAYRLEALRHLTLATMTDDFHFDTQIIVKLHHQQFRIREVPIPTYYGDEVCHVNGVQYAWNVIQTLLRYRRTVSAARSAPEYAEFHPARP